MKLEQKILGMEKSLLTFEVRHSREKLMHLISSDFREIGASGRRFGIEEILIRLPKEEFWSCQAQDWEFRMISRDVAQVIFRAFIKHLNTDEGTYSSRSSIWVQEENCWKMIFHQGTKIDAFEVKS